MNPYQILGVPPDADIETITESYRRLAKKFHPDRNPGDDSAVKNYHAITTAFEILSDPVRRAKYDESGDVSHRPTPNHPAMDVIQPLLIRVIHELSPFESVERTDLIGRVRIYVTKFLNQLRDNGVALRGTIEKTKPAAGRFTVNNGENFLESVIQIELNRLERELGACNAEIAKLESVIEYLRDCKYRMDTPGAWDVKPGMSVRGVLTPHDVMRAIGMVVSGGDEKPKDGK